MFTGLIEKRAVISARDMSSNAGKLTLCVESQFKSLVLGESIAVNGACLTLESYDSATLTFHVLEETFSKTNLGMLPQGAPVNLERAMVLGSRIGGHLVSGHVDAVSCVKSMSRKSPDWELVIITPKTMTGLIVKKGSIAIDGVSLTIAEIGQDTFTICLIPTTIDHTSLASLSKDSPVNIEADMIAKYIAKQIELRLPDAGTKPEITMGTLLDAGF